MTVFVSKEEHIEVHRSGWVLLPSGVAITRLPLWDYKEGVFARIGQGPGATWMTANGGLRHPTSAELEELHDISLHIDPFTMPTRQQLVDAGVDMTEEAIDAFRNRHMTTLEWCLLHDSEVFSRLFAANWEDGPVANAGKHWTEDGAIYGWWRADGSKIQTAWYKHGKYHTGYGSTTHAVDPTGLSASESSPPPSRGDNAPKGAKVSGPPTQPTSLGDSGPLVGAWQLRLLRWNPSCLPKYGADKDHGDETQAATEAYFKDCGLEAVPNTQPATVEGIDISSHQPPERFDWASMAEDLEFVIARACYGVKPDSAFVEHIAAARAAGLNVGGYIFFRQHQDADEQLDVFEEQLGLAGISSADIVPAVDLEANTFDGEMDPREHNTGGRAITEALASQYGAALIYLSPGHYLELGKPSWVLEHRIWVAHWGSVEEPSWPWGDWDIWQVKATFTHSGFPGPLDFNRARRLPVII